MEDSNAGTLVLSGEVARLADQVDRLRSELHSRPNVWNTYLVDLGEPGYRLRQPLPVLIREYEETGEVTAHSVELEVFGEGATSSAAIAQLKQAVLDLYDELTECDLDELGDLPLSWLRILQRFIERDEE